MEELTKSIQIVRILKQIMDEIRDKVQEEFEGINLTGPQGMLVGILSQHGKMKISELSEKMGFSNSTISGIVDRLEKQGLVTRTRSEEDRRVVYVQITADLQENVKERFDQFEKKIADIMNETTQEEIDRIFEGLNLLKELMEREHKKRG